MEGCKPAYNPGVGPALSPNQPEEKLMNEVAKRRYQVYVIIHRDVGQRPDQLQGRTAGADRTVHEGGRAHGSSSDNGGGGVVLQHDVGAGPR